MKTKYVLDEYEIRQVVAQYIARKAGLAYVDPLNVQFVSPRDESGLIAEVEYDSEAH